jgi:formylglycine-generating enzyme required for sulfatase activity
MRRLPIVFALCLLFWFTLSNNITASPLEKKRPFLSDLVKTDDEEVSSLTEILGKFVKIPSGEFMMGSDYKDGLGKEQPIHLVKISHEFEMGQYEVTQMQWQLLMVNNPSDLIAPNLPVDRVSWNDTQEFIKKLNLRSHKYVYRLPTEAEWEYAAKAGAKTDYTIEQLDSMAWHKDNSRARAHLVGQKQPNKWDLYDMHGNVWEWCEDWYGDYPNTVLIDPIVKTGLYKVLRGGSWLRDITDCRSSIRSMASAGERIGNVGFRLVRNLK